MPGFIKNESMAFYRYTNFNYSFSHLSVKKVKNKQLCLHVRKKRILLLTFHFKFFLVFNGYQVSDIKKALLFIDMLILTIGLATCALLSSGSTGI